MTGIIGDANPETGDITIHGNGWKKLQRCQIEAMDKVPKGFKPCGNRFGEKETMNCNDQKAEMPGMWCGKIVNIHLIQRNEIRLIDLIWRKVEYNFSSKTGHKNVLAPLIACFLSKAVMLDFQKMSSNRKKKFKLSRSNEYFKNLKDEKKLETSLSNKADTQSLWLESAWLTKPCLCAVHYGRLDEPSWYCP